MIHRTSSCSIFSIISSTASRLSTSEKTYFSNAASPFSSNAWHASRNPFTLYRFTICARLPPISAIFPTFCARSRSVSSRHAFWWSLSIHTIESSIVLPIATNGIPVFFRYSAGASSTSVRVRIKPSTLWLTTTLCNLEISSAVTIDTSTS